MMTDVVNNALETTLRLCVENASGITQEVETVVDMGRLHEAAFRPDSGMAMRQTHFHLGRL